MRLMSNHKGTSTSWGYDCLRVETKYVINRGRSYGARYAKSVVDIPRYGFLLFFFRVVLSVCQKSRLVVVERTSKSKVCAPRSAPQLQLQLHRCRTEAPPSSRGARAPLAQCCQRRARTAREKHLVARIHYLTGRRYLSVLTPETVNKARQATRTHVRSNRFHT
jgi:hypothetical protein